MNEHGGGSLNEHEGGSLNEHEGCGGPQEPEHPATAINIAKRMIVLYRQKDSAKADEVQARLKEMVAAHHVRPAEDFDGPQEDLPVIDDSGDRYTGAAVDPFLRTLERELQISRQISADACYIDPRDGETC